MDNESKKSIPSWAKTAAPAVAFAVIFGTAGYFITPRSAHSALQETARNLGDVQHRLDESLAGRKVLDKQMSQTKVELASAVERAVAAAEAVESEKARVAAAEEFIAQLNAKLDQAKADNAPLAKSLTEAKKLAADNKVQADKASGQVDALTTELLAVKTEKQELDKTSSDIRSERARLAAALASQQQTESELKRFLAMLEVGGNQTQPVQASASQEPEEMPITTGELIRQMGYPSLTFQRLDHVEMKWSDGNTVVATDGLVTQINGKATSREALAALSVVCLPAVRPPGDWRIARGSKVYYADLVAMFGRPDSVAGTGGQLQACWTVGAWARRVSATVVDGVVTQFDGRNADGAMFCELIRHRAAAYKSADQTVQANAVAAQAAYDRAAGVVGQRIAEEANLKSRDGVKLVRWNMAPLESVGTWISQANASAGSATVRAWVDCTWAESDGSRTDERRYVVVTLFGRDQKIESAECTIFASCD